jgi:hypothetical protein
MTRYLLALGIAAALVALAGAEEGKAQPEASQSRQAMSRYCVREGESLQERINRLEVALRLAKLEQVVNRKAQR